jgi:hypothetical protein
MFVQQIAYYTETPSVQSDLKNRKWGNTPSPPKKKQKKRQTKSTQGPAATRGKEGKRKTGKKNGFAYCPATEEVQSNQKQAEGTASSLIKRWICLLSRYRSGSMQPKTGLRHRLIRNGCNDSTRNVEPSLNYLSAATLKHCSLVKKRQLLTRHPWQLFNSLKGRCNRRRPEISRSGGANPRRSRNCTNQDSAKRRAPYKTLLATAATQTLLKL